MQIRRQFVSRSAAIASVSKLTLYRPRKDGLFDDTVPNKPTENSRSETDQQASKFPPLLWDRTFYYRVHKTPAILSQLNPTYHFKMRFNNIPLCSPSPNWSRPSSLSY